MVLLKIKAQISPWNMHKYKKHLNEKMPRPSFISSFQMDFFITFEFLKIWIQQVQKTGN